MFRVDEAAGNWPAFDETPRLSPNEVHVFAVVLGERAVPEEAVRSILSHEERQRAEKFQFDRPRRQFVITRAALRTLLGRLLDVSAPAIELVVDSQGKPHLDIRHSFSNLRFNVAHSGDVGLIAIAIGCDVGIDVESAREIAHLERIAQRYFQSAEFEAIEALPSNERASAFLRCWTGKEAVVKSIGRGLAESLSRFSVPVVDYDGTWIDIAARDAWAPARIWLQPLALNDDYIASVACVGEERRARCFTFGW